MRRFGMARCFAAMFLSVWVMALTATAFAQQGSVVGDRAAQSVGQASSKEAAGSKRDTTGGTAAPPETEFEVPDAARRAILFTKYALDVRLETRDATLHARAIVTVKNESTTTLNAIPLQVSSSLAWEVINVEGKPLRFAHHAVATDADHTGVMNEALVTLPAPLAAGGEQTLTVFYGGAMAPAAQRLTSIGTPPDVAMHSD